MKIKMHLVVAIIVIGHLVLPVATTHAGGITPVPKLVMVNEASAVVVENTAGTADEIFPIPPRRQTARSVPGQGFRDLAINRLDADTNDFTGAKIYIADANTGSGTGRILRLDITPGNTADTMTTMYDSLSFPSGIEFARHADVDYLYWSDKNDMEICWIFGDIDCGGDGQPACPAPTCVSTSPNPPGPVRACTATDPRCLGNPMLFWTESTGSIRSTAGIIPVVGAAVVSGLSNPVGLSIGKNKIYWTEASGTGQIGRADLAGTNVERPFVPDVADSVGVGVGFHGNGNPQTMLWTLPTTDGGRVKRRAIGNSSSGKGHDFGDPNNGPVTGIRVLFPPGLVPATSTWGIVVMLLLVLAGGTIVILRRRTAAS